MADVQHAAQTGADLHEPKGVASANLNEVYIANGAGSGSWDNQTAFIEVKIDLGGTLTRSFVGATAYTDFILDYIAEHATLFSYNDTTKEITYTGAADLSVKYSLVMSMSRTDLGGSPEVTVAMFEDVGAGFVEITSSRVARSFTNNDVGSLAMNGIHTFSTGDKMKLRVKTDASIDIELRNLVWTLNSIGPI